MHEKSPTLWEIVSKTTVIHTLTYFVIGLIAFSLFDYSERFADPALSSLMRPTDDPLVQAGILFQPIRGVLFGLVFYLLRDVLFRQKNGWLIIWITLIVIGMISTFGTAPGSIEGLIYTKAAYEGLWGGQIEVLSQSLLFSILTWYWVNHTEKRWLSWVFGIVFFIALALPALGLLARQMMS
ncbi:MAG TPA: hypothetical protein VFR47_21305 [Anaerolineales bacterium]|nr:hypothetical protein [Anaerolineales bacterium]